MCSNRLTVQLPGKYWPQKTLLHPICGSGHQPKKCVPKMKLNSPIVHKIFRTGHLKARRNMPPLIGKFRFWRLHSSIQCINVNCSGHVSLQKCHLSVPSIIYVPMSVVYTNLPEMLLFGCWLRGQLQLNKVSVFISTQSPLNSYPLHLKNCCYNAKQQNTCQIAKRNFSLNDPEALLKWHARKPISAQLIKYYCM